MYEEQKKKTLKLKLELMGARNMKQNRDFEIERLKGQLEMVWKNYHKLEEENEELKKQNTSLKKALEYTKKNKVNEDEIEKLKKENQFECDVSFIQGCNYEGELDAECIWYLIKDKHCPFDKSDFLYVERIFYELFNKDEYIIKDGEVVYVNEEDETFLSESQDVGGLDTDTV